ncbi:hypothetical protein [Candidatus Palauibacter sp.]|uniref:hypothetical protein n=1 Tax=Candidatus Palauibacter sp. TaxID=3101350 RepID=UPI003B02DF12
MKAGQLHIRGLAGDFFGANWDMTVAEKFMQAARDAEAGYAYIGPMTKQYVHIDWRRPKEENW